MRISGKMIALVAALLVTLTACSTTRDGTGSSSGHEAGAPGLSSPAARTPTGIAEPSTSVLSSSAAFTSVRTALTPLPQPIHVSLLESDGSTYGVGMPTWSSRAPADASAFDKAESVTVIGRPAGGAWSGRSLVTPGPPWRRTTGPRTRRSA